MPVFDLAADAMRAFGGVACTQAIATQRSERHSVHIECHMLAGLKSDISDEDSVLTGRVGSWCSPRCSSFYAVFARRRGANNVATRGRFG